MCQHPPSYKPISTSLTGPPPPQLATQFYASIRYISTHHPPSALPSQPSLRGASPSPAPPSTTSPPTNPAPSFAAATQELARDLLIKTSQIAYLISVLPGVENSAAEQEARIGALEMELRRAEQERGGAVAEMERWRGVLEGVLGGVRR